MYFPVLRGKQFELVALGELAPLLAQSPKIVPVIEPVEASPSLRKSLKALVAANAPFCLVVNPKVTTVDVQALAKVRASEVGAYSGCVATLCLSATDTPKLVEQFAQRYPADKAVFFVGDPPAATVAAAAAINPKYVLFRAPRILKATKSQFAAATSVQVEDAFNRQARNVDYPPDDAFSDAFIRIPDAEYAHFGDYSIVGDHYSKTGGPAYCVALHHVYATPAAGLRIARYLSTSNLTTHDRAGKFAQALAKLVKAAPLLGAINQTPTVADYQSLHQRKHFPGLGAAKKLAIKHHLQLMERLLP